MAFLNFMLYKNCMKTKMKLTAIFEEAEEGGYVAFIEELPGVNTQGDTLEESKANLLEALEMVLQTQRVSNKLSVSKFFFRKLSLGL